MRTLALITIGLNTKYEMPRFTRFRDMTGPQNLKVGHVTLTTPICGYFVTQG